MKKGFLLCSVAITILVACGSHSNPTGGNTNVGGGRGMVLISGGTFEMGQVGIATPVHQVTVSSFYIDTTEVTQADYTSLMGVNPSYHTGDSRLPVEQVSWFDAALYCNQRSKRDGKDSVYRYTGTPISPGDGCTDLGDLVIDFTKNGYRLPTDAEYEYACRAGTTTLYFWGDSSSSSVVGNYAWYDANSGGVTHAVSTKSPNEKGLYDMVGNVYEWCNDWFADYDSTAQTNPTGPASGSFRVLRGFSFGDDVNALYSANRDKGEPGFSTDVNGFRCVCSM